MTGVTEGYADKPIPLRSYAALAAVFNVALATGIAATREDLPERFGPTDLVLLGVATHKFSRLVAKDRVTSFLRAPFVRYEGEAGPSEVSETPRGQGAQRAIGELINCPFCLGMWIASGLGLGFVAAPRVTRFLAGVGAALAVADFLHLAHAAATQE
jgi:Protein of unknown function (DUF1360)